MGELIKIFAFFAFLLLTITNLSASSQGFTVQSVSLTNILHPGDSAINTQWLVQIALNGGGQSLSGTIDESTINYQGLTSVYPLQISGSTDPEKAFYIINNDQPQPINTYTSSIQTGGLTSSCFLLLCGWNPTPAPACPTQSNQKLITEWQMKDPRSGKGVVIGRLCVYSKQIGVAAPISAIPNIQFGAHIDLVANGKKETLDIDYNQQSVTSSGGLVQANWAGSLVTGNAPPSGTDYIAVAGSQGGNWVVKTQADYKDYDQNALLLAAREFSVDTPPKNCDSTLIFPGYNALGDTNFQPYIDGYMTCLQSQAAAQYASFNKKAGALLQNGVTIGGKPVSFSQSKGKPAFSVDLDDYFVTNPVLVLRFRGDFLGVVIPLGKPKILSAKSECFNSGNQGTIKLTVQNIGTADGSFYPDLSDCSFISSPSLPKYSVAKGKTQDIEIPIYGIGQNTNLRKACNVKVTDFNGGGSTSAQVSICIKEANQCTPGKPIVQENSICACKNFDGTYKPAPDSECTYCEHGVVIVDSGKPACQEPSALVSVDLASDVAFPNLVPLIANILLPEIMPACGLLGPFSGFCSDFLTDFVGS